MGLNGNYKVLSPIFSWDVSGEQKQVNHESSNPTGSSNRSKQQKVLEFVKRWLLCGGGWVFDSSEYAPVISPGKSRSSSPGAGGDGYVKPPKWKQFLRRVRARTKRVQNACCEGLCFHPQQQQLNYCSTDSYERNFDRGREFWEDQALFSSKSASMAFAAEPVNFSGGLRSAHSETPMLWEKHSHQSVDHFFASSQQRPIAVAVAG